ncbi:MAG TPA: alpha/beta fold hydrolase, partial [Mycobacteriales bacterium]|nr:alpha/beta fold hydrolase [Mycobacteriales bacterium]
MRLGGPPGGHGPLRSGSSRRWRVLYLSRRRHTPSGATTDKGHPTTPLGQPHRATNRPARPQDHPHDRAKSVDRAEATPTDSGDHLGVERVVAIGHSLGGSVVSALAVEYPERVTALVAVDPAYLLPDETAAAIGPLLDALATSDPVPIVQQLIAGMDSPARDEALRTWQVRRIAGMPPHVLREALVAQVTGPALGSVSDPYLRRRTCPVLTFYADPARAEVEAAGFSDPRSRVVTWE